MSQLSVLIMCHAPIVIPEIAGDRFDEISQTTNAMSEMAQKVLSDKPDVLVVVSPHAPRPRNEFGVYDGEELLGNFGQFGFRNISMKFKNAKDEMMSLKEMCMKNGIEISSIGNKTLDHGSMVPLWFMKEAGWSGRTMVLSFSMYPNSDSNIRLGKTISDAAKASGKNWVLLASGDMSHRLIEDAPAGFHPKAKEVDRWVVDHMKKKDLLGAISVDPNLKELAAEDVIDSLEVAKGALSDLNGFEFCSYEGPFGVGYMNAILRLTK